jgi:hypothetical protein
MPSKAIEAGSGTTTSENAPEPVAEAPTVEMTPATDMAPTKAVAVIAKLLTPAPVANGEKSKPGRPFVSTDSTGPLMFRKSSSGETTVLNVYASVAGLL